MELAGGAVESAGPAVAVVSTGGAVGGTVDATTGVVVVVAAATASDTGVVSPLGAAGCKAATALTGSWGPEPSTAMSSASPKAIHAPARSTARQWANR
jgi:hypothetical protein